MFGIGYGRKVTEIRRAFDGIVEGNEYQAVIFKAMRKMLANIFRYGFRRRECETGRQFFHVAEVALPVDRKAVGEFLAKFEQARYSHRVMGEPDRSAAIVALRAIQYSLEKIPLTEEQLAVIASGGVKRPDAARLAEPPPSDRWVIPPPVAAERTAEPGKKYRFAVMPRSKNREAVLKEFGARTATGGGERAGGGSAGLRQFLASGDLLPLGELLVEEAGAEERRVHVDGSLVSYLLEFQQRGLEAGLFRVSLPASGPASLLRAANVLSLSEGRDFMVPDDLKVALLSAGPRIYHAGERDVRHLLDEEVREIEAPRGLFGPKPIYMQGLPVPFA